MDSATQVLIDLRNTEYDISGSRRALIAFKEGKDTSQVGNAAKRSAREFYQTPSQRLVSRKDVPFEECLGILSSVDYLLDEQNEIVGLVGQIYGRGFWKNHPLKRPADLFKYTYTPIARIVPYGKTIREILGFDLVIKEK